MLFKHLPLHMLKRVRHFFSENLLSEKSLYVCDEILILNNVLFQDKSNQKKSTVIFLRKIKNS